MMCPVVSISRLSWPIAHRDDLERTETESRAIASSTAIALIHCVHFLERWRVETAVRRHESRGNDRTRLPTALPGSS